jgi:hypothetical protein
MNALLRSALGVVRSIAGLFFDDGSLAMVVIAILATTAILAGHAWFDASEAMFFLVGAVIAALLENVLRTARRSARVQ